MIQKTLYNKDLNLEFYHITKNAMTAIINTLQLKWTNIETLPDNRKTFAVIRNPIKRCVSGFIEIHKLYQINIREHTFKPLNKELEDLIFKNPDIETAFGIYIDEIEKNGFFEQHNLSQNKFLDGYIVPDLFTIPRKIENVTDYILFEDMDKQISNLINKDIKIKRLNVGNKSMKDRLYKILPTYEERIKNIYLDDWELYQKILNGNV